MRSTMTALILDCDGVLAETERHLHLPAFNRAFEELGVGVHWSDADYAEKLLVSGGLERMATSITPEHLAARGLPDDPGSRHELLLRLHARKGRAFEELLVEQALPARAGIVRLVQEANEAGWKLAVASTSSERSARAVLDQVVGMPLAARIPVFAGDVVRAKKPAPEIYELALDRLGVSAREAVAIEDSRNGLLAATRARLGCVVTVSDYTAAEDFREAALVVSSLGDPGSPMTVIANRSTASPGAFVRLEDLEAVRAGLRTVD